MDMFKKLVTAAMASLGAMLVAMGVVSADMWASVITEPVIVGLAGVLSVIFYGLLDRLSKMVMGMFKSE